jgi:asparagine synthase (glutamine-hydrolysing)
MLAALDHRGRDGSRLLLWPSAVLGHQHFWTTPEEVGEVQPLSDAAARIDVVLDGRLDNRSELFAALGEADRSLSDAALALRAYTAWGESCVERFLGPFAVAFWDGAKERLVAARDAMGSRTLYYRLTPKLAILASEEAALLAHPAVGSRLNEEVLAEFFAVSAASDGGTFFAEVSELLPGRMLLATTDAAQVRRFWQPDPGRRIEYRSDGEYAEEFRSLLEESVRCRLRTVGPPGVMMSGGMDSPAIAALAAVEMARKGRQPLMTFSWVFDELAECDERRWIAPMVRRFALDATYLNGDRAWPLRDLERWPIDSSRPWANAYRLLMQKVYRAAAGRGCRTVLNGAFSDSLYTGMEEWLTDLVRDGHLADVARETLQVVRSGRTALLADAGIRRFVRRALLGLTPDFEPELERLPWLTAHARRLLRGRGTTDSAAFLARRPEQYEALFGSALALNAPEAHHANACGVEVRDPYLDRRLVEFMLAIPAHQLYGRGRTKYVHRNALSGLLPPEVTDRSELTGLTPLFDRGTLERELGTARGILAREEGLWREYVSEDWLFDVFPGRMRETPDGAASLVPWQCVTAQLWSDAIGTGKTGLRSTPGLGILVA